MINYKLLSEDEKFTPSNYQKDIFEAIARTNNNISIEATAGSGKTTSILLALKLIPKFRRTIFLSYSNTIVNELKERVPSHIKSATLHSLGYSFITTYYPQIKVDNNKYLRLALDAYGAKNKEIYKKAYQIQDISQFVRMTLTKLDSELIFKMCDQYDIDCSEETVEKTIELIRADQYPRLIDFADMIFYPATNEGIVQETFHNVMIDEAQDISTAQIEFIKNITKKEGRIISVGDSNQAIYSFAGADVQSFQRLKSIPNTTILPLSISYRCAKNIVLEAQKIYPEISYSPKAKEGIVRQGQWEEIEEGDMVLSRNNAPLVDIYYKLIDSNIKAKIYGKEIEKGIISFAEECMSPIKDRFVQNLIEKLNTLINDLYIKGFTNPQKSPRYENLCDKIDLLEIICNKCNSTAEIIPTIKNIFSDDTKEGVKLMSIHKSKGLENDRVFFLQNYKGKQLIPSQYATQKWQLVQEENLRFVATTRAKNELVYFNIEK
jgi:DNA helicase-2/ATP-dependent DNA helicase PcrA